MNKPNSTLRRFLCAALASTLVSLAPSESAWAETDDAGALAAGAEMSVRSRYIWRGLPITSGAVLQPSSWVSLWDCSATSWANITLPDPEQDVDLTEVDLGMSCSVEAGFMTATFGGWVYLFPGSDSPATVESKGLLTARWDWLRIFTGHAVDMAKAPGAYSGWLGVGGEWDRRAYRIDASVRTGWANESFNRANTGVAINALDYMGAEVAVPFGLGAGIELRPHLGGVVLLPQRLTDAFDQTVVVDFGVSVSGEWPL